MQSNKRQKLSETEEVKEENLMEQMNEEHIPESEQNQNESGDGENQPEKSDSSDSEKIIMEDREMVDDLMEMQMQEIRIISQSLASDNNRERRLFIDNLRRIHARRENGSEREDEEEKEPTEFDTLFEKLQSDNTEDVKNFLAQLNSAICMSNESAKGNIKPRRFVKKLLAFLDNEFDAQLMVMSSNCLLSLIDLFPDISESIVDEGGLKILEEKGKNIQYIDVAEDCAKLLNKVAENCPLEVWQSGCALTFLNIIDFFDKSVQNTIIDLLKRCIREFHSMKQWDKQLQE